MATPIDIANQIVLLSSNKLSGHVTGKSHLCNSDIHCIVSAHNFDTIGQVLMVEGGMEGRLLNRKPTFFAHLAMSATIKLKMKLSEKQDIDFDTLKAMVA